MYGQNLEQNQRQFINIRLQVFQVFDADNDKNRYKHNCHCLLKSEPLLRWRLVNPLKKKINLNVLRHPIRTAQ